MTLDSNNFYPSRDDVLVKATLLQSMLSSFDHMAVCFMLRKLSLESPDGKELVAQIFKMWKDETEKQLALQLEQYNKEAEALQKNPLASLLGFDKEKDRVLETHLILDEVLAMAERLIRNAIIIDKPDNEDK